MWKTGLPLDLESRATDKGHVRVNVLKMGHFSKDKQCLLNTRDFVFSLDF